MIDGNTTTGIIQISKEVHDLLDTALKIGIPIFFALVTSLVTWFFTIKTTKKNHEHELIKLEKNYEQEITKLEKNQKHEIEKLEKTHDNEINKIKLQMKIKIVEDIQQIIDEYFTVCVEFSGIYLNCAQRKMQTVDQLEKEDKSYYDEYKNIKKSLKHEVDKARKARKKLELLGFKSSEKILGKLNLLIIKEYNKTNDNKLLNQEEYEEFHKKLLQIQSEYFIAFNKDIETLK